MVLGGEFLPLIAVYRRVAAFEGNHTFRIGVNATRTFEYMIAGAWSEGAVNTTPDSFLPYVRSAVLEYNNPPAVECGSVERKEQPAKTDR